MKQHGCPSFRQSGADRSYIIRLFPCRKCRTMVVHLQKTGALFESAPACCVSQYDLSILALTSSFRLLLTLYRRLFVMLSLTNFSDNAVLRTRSLKTLQSGVQRLVLTNANFCHLHFPPFAATAEANLPPDHTVGLPIYTTNNPQSGTSGISFTYFAANYFCNIKHCTTYCRICQDLFLQT